MDSKIRFETYYRRATNKLGSKAIRTGYKYGHRVILHFMARKMVASRKLSIITLDTMRNSFYIFAVIFDLF